MNKRTLKSCLESLRQVRVQIRGKLDPSIIQELDEAMYSLALLLESEQEVIEVVPTTIDRTLDVLGKIVKSLGWLHDLIEQFLE